jgi:hypothetical protein
MKTVRGVQQEVCGQGCEVRRDQRQPPHGRPGRDEDPCRREGIQFPYVFDKSGKLATEYGARVTPHIFVLDENRNVAFVGSFDDNQMKPSKSYVADAVDALLAGKKVETTKSKAFGCGIAN